MTFKLHCIALFLFFAFSIIADFMVDKILRARIDAAKTQMEESELQRNAYKSESENERERKHAQSLNDFIHISLVR